MMQRRQGHVLTSLRAAQQFVASNRDRLPTVYASGARIRLDEIISEMDEQLAAQAYSVYAAEGETKRHYALRVALQRDHMAPLAKVAAGVLTESPELAALRLPLKRLTPERLSAYARGMAAAAAPHRNAFVAAGLQADFPERLGEAAAAMMEALDRRKQVRARRVEATQAVWRLSSEGRKVVHMLDAFVKSALHDDPALLQGWNTAKRVELTGTRSARRAPTAAVPAQPPRDTSSPTVASAVPASLPAATEAVAASFPRRLLATAERAPGLFPTLLRAFRHVSESDQSVVDVNRVGPRTPWRRE